MRLASALSLLALGSLALGCSDPDDPPSSGDATEGSTQGTDVGDTDPNTNPPADSTNGPSTANTDGPTDDAATETGPGDAPPVIESFTVDGSTMPAELQAAGLVTFEVDATDDVAIDRVEIYDGEELIATLPSAPYQVELLLSSVDSGGHFYTAVAFDSIGQQATSEVVPLSVNVLGGEMLVLRDHIGTVRVGDFWMPKVGLRNGSLDVIATTEISSQMSLAYWRYDAALSLVGQSSAPPPAPYINLFNGWTAPTASADGDALIGAGAISGAASVAARGTLVAGTATIEIDTYGTTPSFMPSPLAVDHEGNVVFLAATNLLEKRTAAGALVWQVPIGGPTATAHYVAVTSNNDIYLVVFENDCGPEPGSMCLRTLTAGGTIAWTRSLPGTPYSMAVSPENHVATLSSNAAVDPLQLLIYDEAGVDVSNTTVGDDHELRARSIAYDPQGHLLIAGHRSTNGDYGAWAARIDTSGSILWSDEYLIGLEDGFTGLTVTPEGRVYVVGFEDTLDHTFVDFQANALIAELAL